MTEDNNNGDGFVFNPDDYTYALPDVAKAWLAKYGVTSTEIAHFNVCWNKMTDSLCFPVIINDKVAMTSERYFGDKDNHPKYIIKGEKNKSALFITHFRNKDMVVFVEDYVSAIKVARHTGACPLFGSTIPRNTLKWAVERFKTMRVWLDMDKAYQSVLEASKLSQYASDTRSIVTQLDPKEYTNQELINILSKYGAMGT